MFLLLSGLLLIGLIQKNMNKNDVQKIINQVKVDYDLIAREWNLSRNRASQLKISLISEIKENDKVLDLGCGNGLMVPFILEQGGFYQGVDISENLLKIAKEKYQKVNFFKGQVTALPFKNEEFDFVISFAVLHHLPSRELQEKFFQEIRRVAKFNTKIKIIVWNLLSPWTNKKFKIEQQLAGGKSGDVVVPWKATKGKIVERYLYQFSKEELFSLAEKFEFKNIKINYFTRAGEKKENGEELVLEMEK